MKKIFNFILSLAIVASLTGCGDNTPESTSDVENSQSSVAVDNSKSQEEPVIEEETTQVRKQDYINMHGVKVAIPPSFENEQDVTYWTTYSGLSSANDRIYYGYNLNIFYGSFDSDLTDFTCKDVPDILEVAEMSMVNDFFDYLHEKNVETEDDVEVNGFPFLKQTGTFKVILDDEDDTRDVYFIGYYGAMNLDYAGGMSIPMMWLAYSEITDEATKADMENIMNDCMEKAVFIEEE